MDKTNIGDTGRISDVPTIDWALHSVQLRVPFRILLHNLEAGWVGGFDPGSVIAETLTLLLSLEYKMRM
jgi:hypothetical protein